MDSGFVIFAIGIFFIGNIYWNNKLYAKKVELEQKERGLRLVGELNIYNRLNTALENVNDGLGEWQSVTETYCPEWATSIKLAQQEIEEIIHDLEVIDG